MIGEFMYGYIYLTEDLETHKIYIGQHKAKSFDTEYYGSGKIILVLLKKYGKDRFNCSIIETCETEQELNEKEIYYISLYNSRNPDIGYNIATGGAFGDSGYHQGMLGKHQSDFQKSQASQANSYKRNASIRTNMSKAKLGNTNASGNKGLIPITNGMNVKRIKESELDSYLSNGWNLGWISQSSEKFKDKYSHSTYINKDGKDKCVDNSELNLYLSNGWNVGKTPYNEDRKKKISEANKGKIAITDGNKTYYIKPEIWYEYEPLGYHKMSLQKYKKLQSK